MGHSKHKGCIKSNGNTSTKMASSGILRHVAIIKTDVSEELNASFIRVTTVGELGTTVAVTSNRCMLQRNSKSDSCHPDEGGAKFLQNVGAYKNHLV
jgi:hypothetical protein